MINSLFFYLIFICNRSVIIGFINFGTIKFKFKIVLTHSLRYKNSLNIEI